MQRLPGESFDAFRTRRSEAARSLAAKLRGVLVHDPKEVIKTKVATNKAGQTRTFNLVRGPYRRGQM